MKAWLLIASLATVVPLVGANGIGSVVAQEEECLQIFSLRLDGKGLRNISRDRCDGVAVRSPSGKKIAAARYDGGPLWTMGIDGSAARRVAEEAWGSDPGYTYPAGAPLAWSPNEKEIAYVISNEAACGPLANKNCTRFEIRAAAANGSGTRALVGHNDPDRGVGSPSWSARGIAFESQRNIDLHSHAILVSDVRGRVRRGIAATDHPYQFVGWPRWSTNMKWLVYVRNHDRIVRKRADGRGPETRITRGVYPAWSPDGKRLAFLRYLSRRESYELYVTDANGKLPRRITLRTPMKRTIGSFSWSPKSRWLAAISLPVRNPSAHPLQIDLIRADGRARRRIVRPDLAPGLFNSIFWSADGKRIFVTGAERFG